MRTTWVPPEEAGETMTLLEYAMRVVAVIVIVFVTVSSGLVLLLTAPGLMVAFVVVFTSIAALGAGGTLLATAFLFPETVAVPGFVDLLWLVVPACLASVVVFDFFKGIPALLERTGLPLISMIETILRGLFVALALLAAARFLPGTALSPFAALAAGGISAFVRYYVELWFVEVGPGDEAEALDEEPV